MNENLEPRTSNRTEPNPEASEMCLKKAMAAHSISFFWSASLCIWKIRLASTLTLRLTHTHLHTHRHRKRHGKLFCSVGKWKKWIFDRFMTIEPESSPFLNYCHRNRRTKFRISFAFCFCFFFFPYVLPPAHWVLWFGFVLDPFWAAPLLTGQEKEARLWQVSFQCRAASYLGHEKGLL